MTMLFHVTITHGAGDCPGFNAHLLPKAIESLQQLHVVAERCGVTVHGLYNALPDHVEYLVCEADGPPSLAMFLTDALPYGHADTETRAVATADELLVAARQRVVAER
jgi:hypothetical protein